MAKETRKRKRKRDVVVEKVFSEPGIPTKRVPRKGSMRLVPSRKAKRKLSPERHSFDFGDARRSVRALAASSLTGRLKREHESQVLLALGAKAEKRKSMPLKMLRGIRTKRAERNLRRAQELKESGVVAAVHSHSSYLSKVHGRRGSSVKRKRDRGLDAGVFRDGGMSERILLVVAHGLPRCWHMANILTNGGCLRCASAWALSYYTATIKLCSNWNV